MDDPMIRVALPAHLRNLASVDGEVMVGAALPAAVPVYPIPASPYVYSYVNGQRVVVEPAARRIVYVVR